jgi:hypothetical protein
MPRTPPPRLAPVIAACLVLVGASWDITALAQDDAPSARLEAAFRDAFLGARGVDDAANAVVQPDATHFDVAVKAAHDGERIFFQYSFPTALPSLFHGVSVMRDGAWVRLGQPPVRGPEASGVYEDKLAMFVDDGSVKGFANQGGWITCHEDVRGMYSAAPGQELGGHPVLGDLRGLTSMPKYLPQSRDTGPGWWEFDGWHAITVDGVDRISERLDHGVFLDLWLWGSHRSNPIGYADNEFVFDFRQAGAGTGPTRANWDGQNQQPAFMFDAAVTGYAALDWTTLQETGYAPDDAIHLIDGANVVPFDPDHAWQEGDTLPAVVLNPAPSESRGMIEAEGRLVQGPDGALAWQVTLWRTMDAGGHVGSKSFLTGRTYDVAVAVHRLATGSRWHFVSLPFTVGIDTPGDVTARRFEGAQPDWTQIEAVSRTLVYPGQTSWQWLTSDDHPGGVQVRTDSMSVVGCHDDVGLGVANKQIETYLAGLTSFSPPELTVARPAVEPGNVVLWFVVLAILILAAAIAIGWLRTPRRGRAP